MRITIPSVISDNLLLKINIFFYLRVALHVALVKWSYRVALRLHACTLHRCRKLVYCVLAKFWSHQSHVLISGTARDA